VGDKEARPKVEEGFSGEQIVLHVWGELEDRVSFRGQSVLQRTVCPPEDSVLHV